MQNKIVVRYNDGRLMKGITSDFMPNRDLFHLVPVEASPGVKPVDVPVRELKAVFFVKDYTGNSEYQERKEFEPAKPVPGRKIKVVFKDSEVILGTTQGYQPGRPGFFIIPADPRSNNERLYVVSAATQEVSFV
jgi:hypothetical protein